jgi:hypothetical protein
VGTPSPRVGVSSEAGSWENMEDAEELARVCRRQRGEGTSSTVLS